MRIAIALRGGVSKLAGRQLCEISGQRDDYVNIFPCHNSFVKHILNPNCHHHIDIFIHSWAVDMSSSLDSLYNPLLSKYEHNISYSDDINSMIYLSNINRDIKVRLKNLFHKNKRVGDFGGISHALSLKKSLELVMNYEHESNNNYDAVFSYRPDLFLIKDILFDSYRTDAVTCNGMPDLMGDFHFFIPSQFVKGVSCLFDSPRIGNSHEVHIWIRRYFQEFLKINYLSDSIIPGIHQEVVRKLPNSNISLEIAKQYGLLEDDWKSYSE